MLVNIKRQHKHRLRVLSLSQISCSASLWWRLGHGWNPRDTGPRESAFLLLLVSEVHFSSVGLESWGKIHTTWPQGRNLRAIWEDGICGGGCGCRKEESCWNHLPSAPSLHIFFFPLRGGTYENIHEYNFFGLQQEQISFKVWPGPWWITFAFIYLKQMLIKQSPI